MTVGLLRRFRHAQSAGATKWGHRLGEPVYRNTGVEIRLRPACYCREPLWPLYVLVDDRHEGFSLSRACVPDACPSPSRHTSYSVGGMFCRWLPPWHAECFPSLIHSVTKQCNVERQENPSETNANMWGRRKGCLSEGKRGDGHRRTNPKLGCQCRLRGMSGWSVFAISRLQVSRGFPENGMQSVLLSESLPIYKFQ